jgi:2-succinyl-5-enolpyruvyl-6-hydroxy-3-cyclohexene-1-carboxylate synthase
LIKQLLTNLPDGCLLFSGNSMAIRYLDSYSGKADKQLQIVGNRGASGIDGNISTFMGLAAAFEGQGKPVAVIGDLAFFHDMNGLIAAKGLEGVLVVINNNGGGIFEQLPQKKLPGFDKYWHTPLGLDYSCAASCVARTYGLPYHKLTDSNQLSAVLEQALEEEGLSLVEVITQS